ncbi:glucokinase [Sulfidibacter corallicola]|uniref:Glucokinase n=1 Tax=Sulfidibacter corallicola TaxID=2818388 RepID=A0A8A4TNR7_SULCO|nr:glucokinase [Sulfidibacter corallicola]QTD51616.1 glucokinase [Sulfidibacter corallicola]
MNQTGANPPKLVGDIGGTNARFALSGSNGIEQTAILACRDFPTLTHALKHYLSRIEGPRPRAAALAVAGPVTGDQVALTNLNWTFSTEAVRDEVRLDLLVILNDFRALALALPHLEPNHLVSVGPTDSAARGDAPRLIVGPGTGLGVAALVPSTSGWVPVSGEGGHISFAPQNEREDRILVWFRNQVNGRVSIERLVSGPGLESLYRAMGDIEGTPREPLSAQAITEAALAGDPDAAACLNQFCAIFGSVAGDLALAFGALGGVYLGGGMIPRFLDFFAASPFRRRFEDKGRMSQLAAQIPTQVIAVETPALLGTAAALDSLI